MKLEPDVIYQHREIFQFVVLMGNEVIHIDYPHVDTIRYVFNTVKSEDDLYVADGWDVRDVKLSNVIKTLFKYEKVILEVY